jgi:hypothetical protein
VNEPAVDVLGSGEAQAQALKLLAEKGGRIVEEMRSDDGRNESPPKAFFHDYEHYIPAILETRKAVPGVSLLLTDSFSELLKDWPRGLNEIQLGVERDGKEVDLPAFVPRTVPLYPTQLYETVSMVLLIFLLVAYYPYRRHDGQLLVLCMMGYAVHRFINESIRIEPTVGLGLTLSQWGSVVIFAAALGIEIYLRQVMPSRWVKGCQEPPPEGSGAPAVTATAGTKG